MSQPLRIGALLSGGGRTLMNIADRIDNGSLNAEVVLVISSRTSASGVERSQDRGFEVRVARKKDFETEDALHDAITAWLLEKEVDLVCLCGYLRWFRLDPPFVGKVMNIHPALLPDFGGKGMYGEHVHRAVIAAGKTESGCTVHFVDDRYDHGPTIVQRKCPVLPDDDADSLAARVFEQECLAYPEAIRLFAEKRVRLVEGKIEISEQAGSGARQ
ncbi:MAG: phosphoribosylglycinamide formyltransferase [Phycisphaerales bacterium]|nr:MAG: phosphoribosylglycinamide formyltransferase [Phycisphaerales bacterium]